MKVTKDNYSPLVTVAMVTYNSEKYVRTAIDSVLASSYTNFELIISDDCSTDNTWIIISEYKDSRIKASQNNPNIREYNNRNKCIDLANGKYIIFIDGDDYIYPHGLEHMVKHMEEHPDCAMGLSRPYDARYIYPVQISPHEALINHFCGKSTLNLALVRNFFKTDILKTEFRFPEKYIAGDHYLRIHIAAKYPSLLIYDGLVHWRLHDTQASQIFSYSIQGILESWEMDQKVLDNENIPLNKKEVIQCKNALKRKINKLALRRLLKLQFLNAIKLIFLKDSIKKRIID